MKKLNLLFAIFIGLSILSCSSDDDNDPIQNNNGFIVSTDFSNTDKAYYISSESDSNEIGLISIILTNVEVETTQANDVNYVSFNITGSDLQTGNYSYSDLNYNIFKNSILNGDNLSGGEIVLEEGEIGYEAISGNLTINSFTTTSMNIEFSFTREDGEIITGSYLGNYSDISE